MGMFAHSYVVVGTTPEALVDFYHKDGTRAFIFSDEQNACAICDDNDDMPDLDLLVKLTKDLKVKAFLGQVMDSSVFVGTVFDSGIVIDEYIDYPERVEGLNDGESVYFLDRTIDHEGRAAEWSELFNVPQQKSKLTDLFHRRDEFLFAEDFHQAILQALLLPDAMIGQSFIEIEDTYNTYQETRDVLKFADGKD